MKFEKEKIKRADAIVIGSGMGGMSGACMMTKNGLKVTVLEAAHVPGGCSSSYKRKGNIFESGATTLVGFDDFQPMQTLEKELGIELDKIELDPSMTVHLDGKQIIRHKDLETWIDYAGHIFGNPEGHRGFWTDAFNVSKIIWKVSGRNVFFPPKKPLEWFQVAIKNNPVDAPVLRFAFVTVREMMEKHGVATPEFIRFVDEQLMITAQADSSETPFIFGAAGITYTNYSNYYVNGGLLKMVEQLQAWMEERGSEVLCKQQVTSVEKIDEDYLVTTHKGDVFQAPVVLSNIPIWNMGEIIEDESLKSWFDEKSNRYNKAWGAFTMGVVCEDLFEEDMTLHHQLHLPEGQEMPLTGAKSVFVSMSDRNDALRSPDGKRTLNISCHSRAEEWFEKGDAYETDKETVQDFILDHLDKNLPGFDKNAVILAFSATPVTWQNWVYRKFGRVGGIPQSMDRSIIDWTPADTPSKGLFLCGDTVYPGQGIPGVTLGGINVYYRIKQYLESQN